MASTVYAFSDIKEYDSEDGFVTYKAGDRIDNVGLSKERIAHLLECGAAATYDRTKSTGEQVSEVVSDNDNLRNQLSDKDARIAELEAKLAEASLKQQPSSGSSSSQASQSTSGSSSSSASKSSGSSSSSK